MAVLIQPSFAKGEISPSLYGRVDTAMYQVGLRTALNGVVHASGGISNRGGLGFVAPVLDHTRVPLLVEFQFRTTDTYLLEFGNLYMRVLRNDENVLDAAVTITDITNAEPAVVTAAAHGFVEGAEVYVVDVEGMPQVNGRRFKARNVTTNTLELFWQIDENLEVDSTDYGVYDSGGTVASVYGIATPYTQAQLEELKFTQDADVITLTHRDHPVRELRRFGHGSWTLTEASFSPALDFPTQVEAVADTTGAEVAIYSVTAISSSGEESLTGRSDLIRTITAISNTLPPVVETSVAHGFVSGDEVEIQNVVGPVELNGRRFTVFDAAGDTFKLLDVDLTAAPAYVSGGNAAQTLYRISDGAVPADNTVTWASVPGAVKYAVYKRSGGLWGLLGETTEPTFHDDNLAPDLNLSPPLFRNPFVGEGNYPGVCTYYEQRRVFASTYRQPDTTWYTRIGQPYNLTVSVPVKSDDAITATLASRKVNEIRAFIPDNDLLVFTSGSEWRVNSGQDAAFEAASMKQKPQSDYGSSHLPPVSVGSTALFIPDNRGSIRSFGYSLQIDKYTGADMSLLADHIFETETIKGWAYARSPDPVIHVVRSDGFALALTYDKDQEVIAWARWKTRGKFERVCTLRSSPAERDEAAYFVVKRTVMGRTVRYIERTRSRRFTDVRDAFFVDSGLTFDNPVAITALTLTNPVIITAPGHGAAEGEYVDLSDIVFQPTYNADGSETTPRGLNDRRFLVLEVDGDLLTLNTDGTNLPAYVEGGSARKPATIIGGLWHLEGARLTALADGNVVRDLLVENGSVTLPRASSRVHLGLPYAAEFETLNIEAPQGTMQAAKKKINNVTVRFKRSRGMFIGLPGGKMEEMKQREFEAMGDPTALLTGDKKIDMPGDWSTNGRVVIRQPYPLPMTILAVLPDLTVGT